MSPAVLDVDQQDGPPVGHDVADGAKEPAPSPRKT
jgi:hypothetical protein